MLPVAYLYRTQPPTVHLAIFIHAVATGSDVKVMNCGQYEFCRDEMWDVQCFARTLGLGDDF